MPALDPVVLFFLLGLAAGLARADLRLPGAIYEFLSMVLLLAIGLKGGVELARQSPAELLPQLGAVLIMGIVLPLAAYPVLRWRLARPDAASTSEEVSDSRPCLRRRLNLMFSITVSQG